MWMMWFAGWYLIGLLFSIGIWKLHQLDMNPKKNPTPRALFTWAFSSLTGIGVFLVFLYITIIVLIPHMLQDPWWKRPISFKRYHSQVNPYNSSEEE